MRKISYDRILKREVKQHYISTVPKHCSYIYIYIYICMYVYIYMVDITFSILFFSLKKKLEKLNYNWTFRWETQKPTHPALQVELCILHFE